MAVASAEGIALACAFSSKKISVSHKYAIGSNVYIVQEARRGNLEVIFIKDVRLLTSQKTFGITLPIYVDNFNGLWNEESLCLREEAVELAFNFLTNQKNEIIAQLEAC